MPHHNPSKQYLEVDEPPESLVRLLKRASERKDSETCAQVYQQILAEDYPKSLVSSCRFIISRHTANTETHGLTEEPHNPGSPESLSDSELLHIRTYGAAIMGPVLSRFYEGLLSRMSSIARRPSTIFFLAREGYLLQRGFEALKQLRNIDIKSEYLITSRSIMFRSLLGHNSIAPLICSSSFEGTIKMLASARFSLSGEEIARLHLDPSAFPSGFNTSIKLPKDSDKIIALFDQNHDFLFELGNATRSAYLSYLGEIGVLDEDSLHIVDLGYSGTIQKCLALLLEKKINGHYVVTTRQAQDSKSSKFIGYCQEMQAWGGESAILNKSLYLEALLTAPSGTAKNIQIHNGTHCFTYGKKLEAQSNFLAIKTAFDGCIDYCRDIMTCSPSIMPASTVNTIYSLVAEPSNIPPSLRKLIKVEDLFTGKPIIDVSTIYQT